MKLNFEGLLYYLYTHQLTTEPVFDLDREYESENTEAWRDYIDLKNKYEEEIDGLDKDSNDMKAINVKYVGLLQDCLLDFRDSFFNDDVTKYVSSHLSDEDYLSTLPIMASAMAYNLICEIEEKYIRDSKKSEKIDVLKAKSLFAMYKMRFSDFFKESIGLLGTIVETKEGATEDFLSSIKLDTDKDLKKFIDKYKFTDKEPWTPVYILTQVSIWSLNVIILRQGNKGGPFQDMFDLQHQLFGRDFWYENLLKAPEYATERAEWSILELVARVDDKYYRENTIIGFLNK